MRPYYYCLLIMVGCDTNSSNPADGGVADSEFGAEDASSCTSMLLGVDLDGASSSACTPGSERFDGVLCGPPTQPCLVKINEFLPMSAGANGSPPAIDVDTWCSPSILFRSGADSYLGWREGTAWNLSRAPSSGIADGALAVSADRVVHALLYVGVGSMAGTTSSAEWSPSGGWSSLEPLGKLYTMEGELVVDRDGVLYGTSAFSTATPDLLTRRSGTWSKEVLFDSMPLTRMPRLALAPNGRLHGASWTSSSVPDRLVWRASPFPEETVDVQVGDVDRGELRMAVSEGDDDRGQPHLLYLNSHLTYATRSQGAWSTTRITETPPVTGCPHPPGWDSCSLAVSFVPVAVMATVSGDVRLLYLREETQRGYLSNVGHGAMASRQYQSLNVAWFENGEVKSAALLDCIQWQAATAVMDHRGWIHVAAYGGQVHYVVFGT